MADHHMEQWVITQLSIMGAIIKLDGWSADRQDGKTICRSSEEQELEQIQRMKRQLPTGGDRQDICF